MDEPSVEELLIAGMGQDSLTDIMGFHMTTKDFAIGVLSVTAVILFAALFIIVNVAPQQAMAIGQSQRAGDFLVSTAQLDETADLVILVDAALQKMNVYGFNVPANQIELVQPSIDLSPLQRVGIPQSGGRRGR